MTPAASGETAERTLRDALDAQRAGRFADAIALCDRALAAAPGHVDAWRLRGFLRYQIYDFPAAERDLSRALELAPGHPDASRWLALARHEHGIVAQEDVLCRELAPRFRPHVADPPRAPLDGVGAGQRVIVVDACITGPAIADALEAEARERGASVVRARVDPLATLGGEMGALIARSGANDVVVCVGCGRPLGGWTLAMQPGVTALVVDRVLLAQALDRLRECSGQGRRRVRLVRSRGAPALPSTLPHVDGGAW